MTDESIQDSNLKLCECGYCNDLILCVDRYGKPRRFKKGHQLRGKMKGENNPMFGVKRFGIQAANWKGGMRIENGYRLIHNPDHPFCDHQGYVREHRLVMEQSKGRYLTPEEEVHHINGIRDDNRIENLMLFKNHSQHISYEKIKDMSGRLCLLCNSKNTTVNKYNRPVWYKHKDGFIFKICYLKKRDRLRKKPIPSHQ